MLQQNHSKGGQGHLWYSLEFCSHRRLPASTGLELAGGPGSAAAAAAVEQHTAWQSHTPSQYTISRSIQAPKTTAAAATLMQPVAG